jgi:xanthine dehydrogenase iron-sulfur cluster and FAD-binding subunit A
VAYEEEAPPEIFGSTQFEIEYYLRQAKLARLRRDEAAADQFELKAMATKRKAEERPSHQPVVPPGTVSPPAAVVTSIDPATAVVGGPDVTLHVYGEGFTAETVILFNQGEEPTTFVSSTEVTTGLSPATATGAYTVSVSVVGAADSVPFVFTEA